MCLTCCCTGKTHLNAAPSHLEERWVDTPPPPPKPLNEAEEVRSDTLSYTRKTGTAVVDVGSWQVRQDKLHRCSCFAAPQDTQMPLQWRAHSCDSLGTLEPLSSLSPVEVLSEHCSPQGEERVPSPSEPRGPLLESSRLCPGNLLLVLRAPLPTRPPRRAYRCQPQAQKCIFCVEK